MILLTGSTGFIGRALTRQLKARHYPIRVLLRPGRRTPKLPRGISVDVTVASLDDMRGLQAALQGVDVVYHLVGGEGEGSRADLLHTDIRGTRLMAQAAAAAGVRRFFYISHLGANTASAFPVLRAKGQAEQAIIQSGVPYTIFRAAILFGENDQFTTGLAELIAAAPGLLPLPGRGEVRLQPLWVEDLVTCMTWALDDENTSGQVYALGGPEYLTLSQIMHIIQETIGIRRRIISLPPRTLRHITTVLENTLPGFPFSTFWMDYLAADRIAPIDTLPRVFNLLPAPFHQHLDHLRRVKWRREVWRRWLKRR